MRAPLIYCLLAVSTLCVQAQTKVPDFGAVPIDQRKMTVCEFDKEAEAVILFEQVTADHNDDRNLITHHHIRIKVLRSKGIERGNIEIYYYAKDDFETINEIRGAVYNFDDLGNQQTKELSKTAIYRQKRTEHVSTVRFALPDVKVGSILEYEYTSVMKHYGGLEDWFFQYDIPVMLSSYSLVILPNAEFAYQVHKSDELPITIKNDKSSGKILFEMNNVAGLRDEPFMDAPRDYRQRIEFQLSAYGGQFGGKTRFMTTWDEVTRELSTMSDFGIQLNKHVSDADDLVNKAKSKPSAYEQMTTIYNYVQRTIDWNGYHTRFAPDGIKIIWDKKKGSSGEINLLLINLLKETGLEVYPLLVSERDHGKVRPDYPFLDQFNNVMAYVLINNKAYILDAAAAYTSPDLIPFSVVNTKAFIVNRKKGGIISLEENQRMIRNRITVKATVDAEGQMEGEAIVNSYDYARSTRMRYFRQSKDKLQESFFTFKETLFKTDSFTVSNTDNDSLPLEQRVQFKLPANSSGDYKLINLNLFTGFQQNPFISDIRFTNIDYGCRQYHEVMEMIKLPESLEPESIPKDLRMIMPDTSITFARFLKYADHTLTVVYRIEISRSVYTAEEYPLIKEFYKKMINLLNEQIVVRKK